jgi:hypothetical protein
MSIVVRFAPKSMTTEQYEQVRGKVQSTSQWPPDGLEIHVCFGSGDQLRVSEVWESREKLDAFGETLMPVLSEAGIELAGEPEILDVHNLELGSNAAGT